MTIALIAHASAQGEFGISGLASMNTTGADFLVAVLACFDKGSTPISDSKGNTWTAVAAGIGDDPNVTVYYCIPTSVGTSHTFSSTGSFAAVSIAAFSGVAQTSPVDQSKSATSATQPGSLTPSGNGYLWITGYGANFIASAPTANSPFTTESIKDHTTGATYASGIAWDIQTTATARNPTWSPANGWVWGVVFKAAAGGGGTTTDTLDKTDLTLTGQSLNEKFGDSLSRGDLTLTGQSVTETVSTRDTLTSGALALAGQSIGEAVADPVSKGDLTLTGQSIIETIATRDTLAAGALALSGQSLADAVIDPLAKADLVLTGQDISESTTTGDVTDSLGSVVLAFSGQRIDETLVGFASPKPSGAPGRRIKFRGQFYDSVRDRHRLARDVNEFLSEKQEEQPKPQKKLKRRAIKVSGVNIETPPVVLDTREIDELSDALAQLKVRDAQYTAYIAQLRAINEALMRDEEEFLLMVA